MTQLEFPVIKTIKYADDPSGDEELLIFTLEDLQAEGELIAELALYPDFDILTYTVDVACVTYRHLAGFSPHCS